MSKQTRATGFYNSTAWKNTRRNYRQSKGGLCERCLARGIVTPAEIVHHKTPLTVDNIKDLSIALGWENLEALCRKCHGEIHEEINRKRAGRRYTVDNEGRVTIKDDTIF
ncbi:MAG: HNH endonuclease [Clostridia bacterium]|nr:HNH endonuclease [Clostridia bacterium]